MATRFRLRRRHSALGASLACLILVASASATAQDRDGDGIPDATDKCPDAAEDLDGRTDDDGCPDAGDRDGDGIDDDRDLCPGQAEDLDGDHDDDGCPDLNDDKDEDGVADADDLCAYEPEDRDGFQDGDGCPDPDNDGDKVADAYDACPLDAEDFDEWEDRDGCPELDNDLDGILDVDDACPDAAEDSDGHDDADGCPDVLVVVTDTHIELTQRIYFVFDSHELQAISHPILDEVASAMAERPALRVRIEGHTDDKGKEAYNLQLSQSRAESVRAYLMAKGVDEDRLAAEGFGESRPLGDDPSVNRRVEFVIVE